MHNQLQRVLRRWHHSTPQRADPLSVWDDLCRIRSLCLAQHVQRQADIANTLTSSPQFSSEQEGGEIDLSTRRRAAGAVAAADHLSDLHVESLPSTVMCCRSVKSNLVSPAHTEKLWGRLSNSS